MAKHEEIWIIDDDPSIRWVLEKALQKAGMQVTAFSSGESVEEQLDAHLPDAIITDIRMPGINGIELLEKIHNKHPDLPVIIMTAHSDLDSAVSSFEGGAFEYLPKPFDIEEAVGLARRACKINRERRQKHQAVQEETASNSQIIGAAPAMQEVFRAIGRLSRSNINVLINGESGTGKELVAHALHMHSPVADKPFIAINTAAIPRDLLESELFGHEKGAFTGAHSQRRGRFEQADGGTLFLDEIGDMPAELQTRLLRVLADGMFYRVGGTTPIHVSVRIIAATHQNLEERVKQGLFREDLFHRLNVIRIHIPALRERKEDIPVLLKHFLVRAGEEMGISPKTLRPEVEAYLQSLDWPGNVRQLENVCRWMTVMASGQEVHMEELPPELLRKSSDAPVAAGEAGRGSWDQLLKRWAAQKLAAGERAILDEAVPMFEKVMIEAALVQTGGMKQDAALLLGWGRNTLTRKMKELNMD